MRCGITGDHTLGACKWKPPISAAERAYERLRFHTRLSGAAFGRVRLLPVGGRLRFPGRDESQDVMALIYAHAAPDARHCSLSAPPARFPEGDVQHWWHPPLGRGVRTHCSDDYLSRLPLATCRYVLNTGDTGVLDEPIQFIQGRPVNAEEDSYYDLPNRAPEAASLYDHCVRAIDAALRFGEHGLPFMGSGDWNDGMNLVGQHGKGESVWLGFFLYEVLTRFAEVARAQGDLSFAERCTREAAGLRRNIETHGWDGEWYRRAYFDDGSPLGSAHNPECRIDSISQSWAVLSGAGDAAGRRLAMEAVDQRLVRREQALIQLLDPPFDKSDLNPGYIKGYVPGVRENGGQSTHAAIWAAMAFAALGDRGQRLGTPGHDQPIEPCQISRGNRHLQSGTLRRGGRRYAVSPHTGRGGWTWYTGSAGWMYRLIVESLLGLRLEVDKLRFTPCLPADCRASPCTTGIGRRSTTSASSACRRGKRDAGDR